MQSAVAHHLPTDVQPVPKQQPPASFPPSLHTEHVFIWYGVSLWPAGVSCPRCVFSQFLVLPSLLTGRTAEEAEESLTTA